MDNLFKSVNKNIVLRDLKTYQELNNKILTKERAMHLIFKQRLYNKLRMNQIEKIVIPILQLTEIIMMLLIVILLKRSEIKVYTMIISLILFYTMITFMNFPIRKLSVRYYLVKTN